MRRTGRRKDTGSTIGSNKKEDKNNSVDNMTRNNGDDDGVYNSGDDNGVCVYRNGDHDACRNDGSHGQS
jgi:hypothetical protein